MKSSEKPDLVKMFLRGVDVKDVSIFFACSEGTVQRVLREAITGLSQLNASLVERAGLRAKPDQPAIPVTPLVELYER